MVTRRPRFRVRPTRGAAQRGVTKLEALLAVAGLAVLGTIGFAVTSGEDSAEAERAAQKQAATIQAAVEAWQSDHARGCPSLSELIRKHHLDRDARTDDPWGNRYRVQCRDGISVISPGKDKKPGTKDDIRVSRSRS